MIFYQQVLIFQSKPEKSLTLLGLPQFTPIFQKYDVEKIFCIISLYAKVRENRSFRKCRLKLEYPSSQTLLLSIKIFQLLIYFALWEIPQDASQCEGNQPLQNKSTDKALKSNFQVESSTVKQKIFKTTHVRKRYIIEKSLNCRMKYSKYSFLCSDKNTKTVVRISSLFRKKVGVSKSGVSKLNNQRNIFFAKI